MGVTRISVVLEHDEETLVLYESDSIVSTKEEFISTSDAGEGVAYTTMFQTNEDLYKYLTITILIATN